LQACSPKENLHVSVLAKGTGRLFTLDLVVMVDDVVVVDEEIVIDTLGRQLAIFLRCGAIHSCAYTNV